MSKSKVLMDDDYSWENSSDIEGDVNWVIDSLIDDFESGEFPGIITITVEYRSED